MVNNKLKELFILLFAALILAVSFNYPAGGILGVGNFFVIFFLIIAINTYSKKFFAHNLEVETETKFWSIERFGLLARNHFKKPVAMIFLPILTSLISLGRFVWMPILEFDFSPKPERISRRHGMYRFTEVTEWHIALIVIFGIVANLFFGFLAYFAGFETFAKYGIIYAFWNIIPFSSLDGTKLLFGSRKLWILTTVIVFIVLFWTLSVI